MRMKTYQFNAFTHGIHFEIQERRHMLDGCRTVYPSSVAMQTKPSYSDLLPGKTYSFKPSRQPDASNINDCMEQICRNPDNAA
jgi:hypothetical protein